MAFKFLAVLCMLGLVAAGDYEYNQPSTNVDLQTNSNASGNTIVEQQNVELHENTEATASQSSHEEQQQQEQSSYNEDVANIDYSQQIPYGYDYNTQQLNTVQAPTYYLPAKYDYSYDVHDDLTGDIKSHSETRDGYHVRGAYSVVDPDGFKRTVTYTADDVNGFNAVVNRVPYALNRVVVAPVVHQQAAVELPLVHTQQEQVQVQVQTQSQSHSQDQQQQVQLSQSQGESHVNTPIQPRDSYAAPPAQTGKGPYP